MSGLFEYTSFPDEPSEFQSKDDELAQLRADLQAAQERIAGLTQDDRYCLLCTWRGPVELVNGVCPQCDVDWPKEYREHRDALTVAQERSAEQARQLAAARQVIERCAAYIGSIDHGENTKSYMMCDDWLAANPAPQEQRP